ncbi:branched chain amino acid aminotransferase [Desulfuromonas versatilis]|uniref:branched-chain-amino-acid transaminase n=1 Tax=Desulfuromonas versatilis TaxID=2802975 RepID=A0ABM8HUX1_9BACT|nr:aminotransferase class IV [Desulfuromonas versatilis]BCR04303.1 branched chain amino acid aminotransferase [Desulfuromonas versatilis]
MIISIDGAFLDPGDARLPVDDGGFLYGDTLFETIKAVGKRFLLLQEHLDRLELSARLLDFPCDRKRLERTLTRATQHLSAPVSRVRLTLTRGSFEGLEFPQEKAARFILTASPWQEPDEEEREAGITCVFAPNRRVNPLSHLPQMKRGNYADCLYAANFAKSKGAREALFITDSRLLLEGATSNLFLVRGDTLATPPAGEVVLGGIMRRQILQVAAQLGLQTEERNIQVSELDDCDEAFITNSLVEVLPIAQVEGCRIARGELWKQLLGKIREQEENKAP